MSNRAMTLINHGGACCGMRHIAWMGQGPEDDDGPNRRDITKAAILDEILETFEREYGLTGVNDSGRVIEVVLTDNQCRGDWPRHLLQKGFKKVARFRNRNTGNICNVFYYYAGWEQNELQLFGHEVDEVLIPAPLPEVRQVLVEYFAHLRTAGRKGPFSNDLEARIAFPRCRTFDRRTVYSDGAVIWEDGV